MDTTMCPPGWATDMIFQDVPVGTCNSSLIAYWIVTMTICAVRFVCAAKRTRTWTDRQHSGQTHGRWPIPPAVSVFASLSYFSLFLLAGLNIVNSNNGVAFSLFSLCFISISFDYLMMLLKMVRLGRKIIPMNVRHLNENHSQGLEKFNSVGLSLLFLQFGSMFASSLSLIILSPIFPKEDLLFGTIGFSFKAAFLLFADIGIFYQYHRVIVAVKGYSSFLKESSPEMFRKNQHAVATLRRRQCGPTFFFTLFAVLVFGLIAAHIIPWTWEWFYLPTAGLETIAAVTQEFFFTKKRHNPKAVDNNTAVGHHQNGLKDQVGSNLTSGAAGIHNPHTSVAAASQTIVRTDVAKSTNAVSSVAARGASQADINAAGGE